MKTCSHRHMYVNIYSSIMFNSQKLATTHVHQQVGKQNVLHTTMKYEYPHIFNHRKDDVLMHVMVWMSLKNITLNERSYAIKTRCYVIIFI